MTRPLVYIAHPLRGDWEGNLVLARNYVDLALMFGYAPMAPYLMGARLNDSVPAERAIGIEWDLATIPVCEEMWLCGPTISEGMLAEAREAERHGIRVRRFTSIADGSTILFATRPR